MISHDLGQMNIKLALLPGLPLPLQGGRKERRNISSFSASLFLLSFLPLVSSFFSVSIILGEGEEGLGTRLHKIVFDKTVKLKVVH